MQGVAADLQFVLNPWIEFGGGVGQRVRDQFNDQNAVVVDGTDDTVTAGGFLNVRPYFKGWMVGLGYHHTYTENINIDPSGEPENQTHDQMFGALQYLLWDRVYIKYVLSYAKAHVERRVEDPADTGFYNESLSHRLRIMLMY